MREGGREGRCELVRDGGCVRGREGERKVGKKEGKEGGRESVCMYSRESEKDSGKEWGERERKRVRIIFRVFLEQYFSLYSPCLY